MRFDSGSEDFDVDYEASSRDNDGKKETMLPEQCELFKNQYLHVLIFGLIFAFVFKLKTSQMFGNVLPKMSI